MSVWRTKPIEQSVADTQDLEHALKKNLTTLDLVVFGVGVCVGAGIFVLTGVAAASNAGPAVSISLVIAAIACGLAALCQAELASAVPVAGSASTFPCATLGELVARTIGWDLVLEFVVGSAAIATSFSSHLGTVLALGGVEVPPALVSTETGYLNLPALLLVLGLTAVVATEVRPSSRLDQAITTIEPAVVLLVFVVGFGLVDAANWSPFVPPSAGSAPGEGGFLRSPLVQTLTGVEPSVYGLGGVVAGAAVVFFVFIGVDVVATTAEETKDPQESLPIGILGSPAIVTVLDVAESLVITGNQPYDEIDPADGAPLATASTAAGVDRMGAVVAVGACTGLIAVSMILFLGQTSVAFSVARDGLLPRALAHTDPRTGTPVRLTPITRAVISVVAALVPLETLSLLVNIGTLSAFGLVSAGVLVLRRTRPTFRARSGFRSSPWGPCSRCWCAST